MEVRPATPASPPTLPSPFYYLLRPWCHWALCLRRAEVPYTVSQTLVGRGTQVSAHGGQGFPATLKALLPLGTCFLIPESSTCPPPSPAPGALGPYKTCPNFSSALQGSSVCFMCASFFLDLTFTWDFCESKSVFAPQTGAQVKEFREQYMGHCPPPPTIPFCSKAKAL